MLTTCFTGLRSYYHGSHLKPQQLEISKSKSPLTPAHRPQHSPSNSVVPWSQPNNTVQKSSAHELKGSTWDFPRSFEIPSEPLCFQATQRSDTRFSRPSHNRIEEPRHPALGLQPDNTPSNSANTSAMRNPSSTLAASPHLVDKHPGLAVGNPGHQPQGAESNSPWLSRQWAEVIDLDDNESLDLSDVVFMFENPAKSAAPMIQSRITSDVRNSMNDEDFDVWIVQQAIGERRRSVRRSLRQPSLPKIPLQNSIHDGMQLHSKVTVELEDGDFMRIDQVLQEPMTKQVFLTGCIFRRMRYMNGTVPKKSNEVCQIVQLQESDIRSDKEQALQEIRVTQVRRRRGLKLTNQAFPALSWREGWSISDSAERIENHAVLVCRWRYVCSYENATAQEKNSPKEKRLIRLREEDCDRGLGRSDTSLREQWRGETVAGGSSSAVSSIETEQVDRERKSAQEATVKLRQHCQMPVISMSPVDGHASPGSSFSTPVLIDPAPHSGTISRNLSRSFNHVAASPSHRQDSARIAPKVVRKTAGPQSAGYLRSSPPIDLTIDDDLITGFQFCSFTKQRREHDRSLRSVGGKQPGHTCPSLQDIVDVDAIITTKSNRGVAERHVEARITTDYSRKRDHHTAFSILPSRCPPLTEQNFRSVHHHGRPLSAKLPYHQRSSSPTDSDATLGEDRSRATIVGEEGTGSQSTVERQDIFSFGSKICSGLFGAPTRDTTAERTSISLQRYTFGDSFSGCGGVSRGARMAGLCLKWAFDFESDMCESYLASFPGTSVHCCSAFDFATGNIPGSKVDVLHLSPPCQFFSPAHTTVGQNDERNTASSFVISALLQKTQPRIVTLENTMGLEQRHPLYLNAVIQQFTDLGFSIRWKVIDLRDFGVPQSRRRLILMAAWYVC